MSALRRLSQFFKASPTLTASLQAGGLMCIGDVISQKVVEKRENFDFVRNAKFGSIGFFMVGPVLGNWFRFLDSRIVCSSKLKTGCAQMMTDQLVMAPAFLATFIAVNSLLQGNSWDKIKSDVTSNYLDILISNYQVWPAVQLFNFTLVPLQYRILLVQSVAVLWNTYLSWKTNRSAHEK